MRFGGRVTVALMVALVALAFALHRPSGPTLAVALVLGGSTIAYVLASAILTVGLRLKQSREDTAEPAAPSDEPEPGPPPASEMEPAPPQAHFQSPQSVRDRLRVLLVLPRPLSSSPDDASAAPARTTWISVTQALRECSPDVELATLWPPTEASLEAAMRTTPRYHLLVFDGPLMDGIPVLEAEDGGAAPVSPGRLADLCAGGGVRAVLLHDLAGQPANAKAIVGAGVDSVITVPGPLDGPGQTMVFTQLLRSLARGAAIARALSDVSALLDGSEVDSRLRPTLVGANWYSLVDRGGDGLGLRTTNRPFAPTLRPQLWFRNRGEPLRDLLGSPQPGGVRLLPTAPPGSGITSLVTEAAHRLADQSDHVIHIECGSLRHPDLASLLETVALALGCPVLSPETLLDSVVGALRAKPALVFIESGDLLPEEDRERLLALDGQLARSSVVVLCTPAEPSEAPLAAEGIDAAGAAALVAWLSQQDAFRFLSDMSERSISALVEGLKGNPLAIRIALGLAGPLGLLQAIRSARETGTLEGVLTLALARLSDRERDAAAALALVPGPVSADVVGAALGRDARPALEGLQRLGLLSDSVFEGDYRLHPLVRGRMAGEPRAQELRPRLARALAAHARALAPAVEEGDDEARQEAIAELLSLRPSLDTVLSWVTDSDGPLPGRFDLVRDCCLAISPALRQRGLLYLSLRLALKGEDAATRLDDHAARARLLLGAAETDRAAGRLEDAAGRYSEAAEAFRQMGDFRHAAHTLVQLGTMYWRERRLADAREPFERALAWLERTGEVEAQVNALLVLGHIAAAEGSDRGPGPYYERAGRLLDGRTGMDLLRAQVHYALGRCRAQEGALNVAASHFSSALDAFARAGEGEGRIQTYRSLGQVYLRQHDRERAIQALERAAQLEARAPFGVDATMDLLRVYMRERRWQEALQHQQRALSRALAAGDKHDVALAHNGMGSVLLELGDRAKAIEHYQEAARLWEELGDSAGLAWTYNNLAVLDRRAGRWEDARGHLDRAARLLERQGDKNALASVYNNIGLILAAQRKTREAAKFYERSLALKEELGDLYGTRMTELNLKRLSQGR